MERHYTNGTEPDILPHYCAGPCRQGRDPCPTPWACQRPEEEDFRRTHIEWLGDIALAAAIVVLVYFTILIATGDYL